MTTDIQNLCCRTLKGCALMLVTVQVKTTSQITPRQSQTGPLNFAACRLNRLKISLMDREGWLANRVSEQFLFQKHPCGFGKANSRKRLARAGLQLCNGIPGPFPLRGFGAASLKNGAAKYGGIESAGDCHANGTKTWKDFIDTPHPDWRFCVRIKNRKETWFSPNTRLQNYFHL